MIEGVEIKKLKVISDERGRLMEMLREDDEIFERFGQVYMTTNYPGVIKAWHYHHQQFDNIVCVKGMIKLVLHDARAGSATNRKTEELFIGENNPMLVKIPPFVLHGWKCISETESIVINMVTQVYQYDDPDEHRRPYDDPEIGYDWSVKFF